MYKTISKILATLALSLMLILLLLFSNAVSRAQGGTVYCVNQSGTGSAAVCNGGYFNSVQAAIDAASPGAEIHIAEGTYTSTAKHIAAITKELRLVGGFDPTCDIHDPDVHRTVLDAQRRGSVISATWPAGDVILEFLTIVNGDGSGNSMDQGCGGGVFAESVNLHIGNCVISNNIGSSSTTDAMGLGGGIYIFGDAFELWDSQIVSNTANTNAFAQYDAYGGGIFVRTDWGIMTMTRNIIARNVGSSADGVGAEGGGVYLYAPLNGLVISNTIENNIAATKIGGSGGGIATFATKNVTIAANRINGNDATTAPNMPGYGGGLYLTGDSVINITRNVISGNIASPATLGGGILNESWGVITLSNNLIVNNTANPESGGGVFVYNNNLYGYPSKTMLFNNTIADNGSFGIATVMSSVTNALTLTLNNNLIVNHTTGITTYYSVSSTIVADTNLLWNTTDPITGTNAIIANPKLTSDYHLYEDSPAVDAGITIPWLTVDLDGIARPVGGAYDIGAYEGTQKYKLYLPLVLKTVVSRFPRLRMHTY